ncbi:MAG: mandelate racemase [Hyphomicrobiales bacterium]|nr:mandelate racemase [Hyphomicrobiales bacterium]
MVKAVTLEDSDRWRDPALTVRALRVRALMVPLDDPIVTASGTIEASPIVLTDIVTDGDITGSSYIFTYSPAALKPAADLIANLEPLICGQPLAPLGMEKALRDTFRLLGDTGLVGMGVAAIDMGLWDALAKARGVPLAVLLGGALKPVPAYYSASMVDEATAARHAEAAASQGYRGFKVKAGHKTLEQDLSVIRAIRAVLGADAALMVDYNQSLSLSEAKSRIAALDAENIAWAEEPLRHHDTAGHAELRAHVETPVQMGENWWGVDDMARNIAAGACDLCMPDAMRIGGVTGWLAAAALAETHKLPMSTHAFPEISGQLMAVTPTAHWLEMLDKARPILQNPVEVVDGTLIPDAEPGAGLRWDEDAVKRYQVE